MTYEQFRNGPVTGTQPAESALDVSGLRFTIALPPQPREVVAMAFALRSPSFEHQGAIPGKHTCEGSDAAPALAWSDPPAGTKSFALIVDDPDAPDPRAPKMTWVHWVLYNLPASARALPEAATAADLPPGAREGLNDWKRPGYRG